jgi:hypothetical protein
MPHLGCREYTEDSVTHLQKQIIDIIFTTYKSLINLIEILQKMIKDLTAIEEEFNKYVLESNPDRSQQKDNNRALTRLNEMVEWLEDYLAKAITLFEKLKCNILNYEKLDEIQLFLESDPNRFKLPIVDDMSYNYYSRLLSNLQVEFKIRCANELSEGNLRRKWYVQHDDKKFISADWMDSLTNPNTNINFKWRIEIERLITRDNVQIMNMLIDIMHKN